MIKVEGNLPKRDFWKASDLISDFAQLYVLYGKYSVDQLTVLILRLYTLFNPGLSIRYYGKTFLKGDIKRAVGRPRKENRGSAVVVHGQTDEK